VSGTACFVIGFVGVLQFIVQRPAVEDGSPRVVNVQMWAWRFVAFFVAGLLILWFAPRRAGRDRASVAEKVGGRDFDLPT
jgi:hypothetical protein